MQYELYKQYLLKLQNTDSLRKLPDIYSTESSEYLNFTTNDYLALSTRNEVIRSAIKGVKNYGVGATGSRLLSGNKKLFENFESRIALDKNEDSSLIFNSGFQANLSVLSSLLDKNVNQGRPLVFFDKLNHSSLYQAVFLSDAELIRYQHNDMNHLSDLLTKFKSDNRPKFIVTETIFGMDGDILPIHNILSLAKEHKAFLYLDEAHATGIIGKKGYGLSTNVDLSDIPHLVMGSFSKALGCSGAYIACNKIIKNYLINKSPGFIYSTANSPMVIAAAATAWSIIENLDQERLRLFSLAEYLRSQLVNLGYNIGNSNSHIIPIILGKNTLALQTKKYLLQNNIIASCIRAPTVPPGTARIRIALNINHTKDNIDLLIQTLKKL